MSRPARPDPADAFLFPVPAPSMPRLGRFALRVGVFEVGVEQSRKDSREGRARFLHSPIGYAFFICLGVMAFSIKAMMLCVGSTWEPMAPHARSFLDTSAVLAVAAIVVGGIGIVRRPPSRPRFPIEDRLTDWACFLLIYAICGIALFLWSETKWNAEEVANAGREHARISLVRVLPDRSGLIVGSDVSRGLAEQITLLLDANPTARTIHLFGPGGSQAESRALAKVIRSRSLDTVVRGGCYSACTVLFAAGRNRTFLVTPDGFTPILGYHGTGLHSSEGTVPTNVEPLRREYLDMGLEPEFVEKAVTTPHYDIWKPTVEELWNGNAITAVGGPYENVGLRWLRSGGPIVEKAPMGIAWLSPVMVAHAPDVLSEVNAWTQRAWRMARNERRIDDLRRSAFSRVLADAVSKASDADVRKAGAYLVAGMSKARMTSSVACARMGARADFVAAAMAVPSPPGSASDPTDPWGALMGRAFGGAVQRGWPAGIALLDDADPATWAVRHASPAPRESCGDLVRWYEAATDLSDAGGPSRLRERFARAALIPADGDDLPGVGRHDHETLAHLREAEAGAAR